MPAQSAAYGGPGADDFVVVCAGTGIDRLSEGDRHVCVTGVGGRHDRRNYGGKRHREVYRQT